MSSTNALSDKLSIWHFDGDILVFSDGALGAAFRVSGIDSIAPKEKINLFNLSLQGMLCSLPEGIRLQIYHRVGGEVMPLVKAHEDILSGSLSECEKIAAAEGKFFRKQIEDKAYFNPETFLFIRSLPLRVKPQGIFNTTKHFERVSKAKYDLHKEEFSNTIEQLQSQLENAGANPKRVNKEEWFDLLYKYMNHHRYSYLKTPRIVEDGIFAPSLADQCALTDLAVKKYTLEMEGEDISVITLKTLPEGATYASMIDELCKLPFYFELSQSIHIPKQKAEIDKLKASRRISHAFSSGEITELEAEAQFDSTEGLLRELIGSNEKILSSSITVILRDCDKKRLNKNAKEVLSAFQSIGAEGIIETYPALDAFLSATPGQCTGLREHKMKSSNIAHLMPLYDYWRGHDRSVCLFPNRDGVLFSLDPFAPELTNWNSLIFGGSGSGKSFSISQMMLQFYRQSPTPKIVWIDNGASSREVVNRLNGEFVDLTIESDICLNMFDLAEGECEPPPSKVKLILAVLELILKEDKSEGLPKRQRALLEEAIFDTYKKVSLPILSDLKNTLENHREESLRKLAPILYSWTGSTAYGKILDGKSTIRLDKNPITFETKGLEDYPDLQNVLLLILTDCIKREAIKDASTPYLLIIDEAWRLFETPSGISFASECYRTFRKYNAGIWSISQNYKDFLGDQKIKDALMPNTSSLMMLPQKNIDWKEFKEALDLSDDEVDLVKSLEIKKGEFGELLLCQNDNKAVVKVMPTPSS